MSEFNRLMRLLEQELHEQEKLLDLLGRERAAIVGLKQDQIDQLVRRKEEVLTTARDVAKKRDETLAAILGKPEAGQTPKFSNVLARCPTAEIRHKLERMGKELKNAATAVHELNSQNSELIRQSLGLVASTIAIFRGAPGKELPTYTESGALRNPTNSPYSRKNTTIVRDA